MNLEWIINEIPQWDNGGSTASAMSDVCPQTPEEFDNLRLAIEAARNARNPNQSP